MSTKRVDPGDIDHLFGRPNRRRPAGAGAPGQAAGSEIPSLRDLCRQFEEGGREARKIAEGLSRQQINWRPAAGRWSIAECFGHLDMVGLEMLPLVDSAIGEARSRAWYGDGPFRPRLLGRWLIKATEPPVRRRKRALDRHVPPADQDPKDVLSAVVGLHALLASRVQAANGLDLSRAKVSAPAASVFRINLFEVFLFLAAHGRRHLRQARFVRENPLFPKPSVGPEQAGASVLARPFR